MVRQLDYNFWKNKKVLITGHTGFKGSWLTVWLDNLGAEVKGFSLELSEKNLLFKEIKSNFNNVKSSYGNILDKSFLEESINDFSPDIIFHLAAQPLVIDSYQDPIYTWETNVIGSLNVLESIKKIKKNCAIVIITTDKVYKNLERELSYKETDQLGGIDPYSSSKAACEIAVSSWRDSFCGDNIYKNNNIKIATARAGNVIGGGDWAKNRLIPDAVKALSKSKAILVRNPYSKRPWQHVLEPLSGYLFLAEDLYIKGDNFCAPFNFGPYEGNNQNVKSLIEKVLTFWKGDWKEINSEVIFHEAKLLSLNIDKSEKLLDWHPKWNFNQTIEKTINWYKNFYKYNNAYQGIINDIIEYEN